MKFLRLRDFINLYDNNKEQLLVVYKNVVGYVEPTWKLPYLKKNVLSKLENIHSLETIIKSYIPDKENYETFEYDFFKYIIGISVIDLPKLKNILENWGLMNLDIIPYEVKQYIFDKHKDTLTVIIKNYMNQSNEYSVAIKLFYFISLVNLKIHKNLKSIEKFFESSNITINGISEIIYLLTKEYKILSTKTLEFISSKPILQWIQEYDAVKMIVDLYNYIFSKSKINYTDVLDFMNSLEDNGLYWILEDCLNEKFSNEVIENLYNLQVLDRTTYENKKVYKISNIGYVLYNKKLPSIWLDNSNIIIDKNLIYIPHNDNPLLILEFMMKFLLTNPGDFLMVFNTDTRLV